VLLVSGWQDLFLEQSLHQYEALRARGVEVALTVGPWTHLDVGTQAARPISNETLAWLDRHLAGGPAPRPTPVHVHRTGEGRWHDLPSWPPPTSTATFQLTASRTLVTRRASGTPADVAAGGGPAGAIDAAEAAGPTRPANGTDSDASAVGARTATAGADTVSFRYDPADPTPSVGGRTLTGSMGVKDNRALESRPDVVAFTGDPLPAALDVTGRPDLALAIAVDPPYADVFVRLCDVDERGRSRNFSDRMLRLDPSVPAGEVQHVTLTLDACFHRLAAGHRLRLQVSGGAFPRFARNLGMPGTPAEGHLLRPSLHTIHCAASRLTLPVSPASGVASTTR
jgi:predicted acyl esterase